MHPVVSVCHVGLVTCQAHPDPLPAQADSSKPRALCTPLLLAGSSVVPPAAVTPPSAAGKSLVPDPG